MSSRWVTRSIVGVSVGVCGLFLLADVAMAAPKAEPLRSLFIRKNAPTFGGEEYVSLEPVGEDVRLRIISVEWASEWCAEPVVRAVERILPHTTVQAVANMPVCSLSERTVERAYKRAESHYGLYEIVFGVNVVVADCEGSERMFVHYAPPLMDTDKLQRIAPKVAALWKLGGHLVGQGPLSESTETLGTTYAPMLLSGKYTELVPDHFVKALKTYTGPPAFRGGPVAELAEREALPLTTYVPAVFPQIALSARIFGDVRLRLTLDPETGAVSDVQKLADKPLLGAAAIDAARRWKFDPAKASREPIDVMIRFHVRCATGDKPLE
jgi:TonB family protein